MHVQVIICLILSYFLYIVNLALFEKNIYIIKLDPEGKITLGDLGGDGIILGWICRRWDVGIWTGLGWPRIETVDGRL